MLYLTFHPGLALSVRLLSGSRNWGSREIATLAGSVDRRREYFIFHRENIQLLGINVCYRQQQQ
jgi:hypothetical protein